VIIGGIKPHGAATGEIGQTIGYLPDQQEKTRKIPVRGKEIPRKIVYKKVTPATKKGPGESYTTPSEKDTIIIGSVPAGTKGRCTVYYKWSDTPDSIPGLRGGHFHPAKCTHLR
jgi:hypothetical protein